MYTRQLHPDPVATLENGSEIEPLITLVNDHGTKAHIVVDDHCYVLTHGAVSTNKRVRWTTHWFPEAFEAARTLPPLRSP